MTLRSLAPLIAAVCFCPAAAEAQVACSLRITKKMHLAGEAVVAVVTITNHAGRELVFQSNGRFQWLDFMVRKTNGDLVNPRGRANFGPMKIAAGQTLAREIDLSGYFQLDEPGNFSVNAVVRPPGEDNRIALNTNRALFSQSQGRVQWSQKVGLSTRPGTREFRLINFSGDSKAQLYAQIIDGSTGRYVRTFLLGDALMLRKPLATVDRQQRMHVLFLSTPTMWVHSVVNADGQLVSRMIHQRGPVGDPRLLTLPDGSVQVANSIPYDPKAAAEQRARVRNASERPPLDE